MITPLPVPPLHIVCLAALGSGQWAAAHDHARQAVAAHGTERARSVILPSWSVITALLHAGDVATARKEVEHLAQWAESSPRLHLSYLQAKLVLARWEGKANVAEVLRQSALCLTTEIGLPHEQARLLTWRIDAIEA